MGVGELPAELGSVGGGAIEGLFIGDELVVFDEDIVFCYFFGAELVEVFGCGVEIDIFLLILDSGDDLFSHLGFGSGVIFPVFGIDVIVGSVGFGFWVRG